MTTTTPPPKPSPLEKIFSGNLGPLSQIRDSLGLSLEELADWMADPQNRQRINDLLSYRNAATESLLTEHRNAVALTLLQIALTDHAELTTTAQRALETRRRACVDILKLRVFDPHKDDRLKPRPPKPPPPRPMMHPDDVRAAWEDIAIEQERRINPDYRPDYKSPFNRTRSANPDEETRTSPCVASGVPAAPSTSPSAGDSHQTPRSAATPSRTITDNTTSPPEPDPATPTVLPTTPPKPARAAPPSTWQPLFNGHRPSTHPREILRTLCPQLKVRFQPARIALSHDDSSRDRPDSLNSHWSRPP